MELKEGYKQTEIGVIPEDWEVKELKDLTTFLTNGFVGVATKHYTHSDEGVTYIQGYNVEENSFNMNGIKKVTKEFHKLHQKSCLKKDDLLTIQTGDIGLTTIVPKHLEGSNCHALIISRFKDKYNAKYFSYYFNSRTGRTRLKELETGSTMKHLNVGDLVYWKIPLPATKEEQAAIAEVLSDTDELITSLEKLIEKKRKIKLGTMQQLLTGKKRLTGFFDEWEIKKLGDIGSCLRGVSYNIETDLFQNDTDFTIRLLRSNNIQNDIFNKHDVQFVINYKVKSFQLLQNSDVLICMANGSKALVGKSAMFTNKDEYGYTFGAFMGCFRTNQKIANNKFVSYLLQSNQYRSQIDLLVSGSSINNLTPSSIESLIFLFPNIEEQTAIAEILSDMDSEIEVLEQKLSKYKKVKQGLMQELLTGKTRLVNKN